MRAFVKAIVVFSLALAACSVRADADTKIQRDFGAWRVDCNESDKGVMKCALRFALINKKSKAIVFGWTILPGQAAGSNKALLQTSTGTLLPEGIVVQFPETKPIKIFYRICGPRYCFAEFDFADSWLQNFNSQKDLSVIFKNGKGQQLKYRVPLEKFAEAYEYYTLQLQKNSE